MDSLTSSSDLEAQVTNWLASVEPVVDLKHIKQGFIDLTAPELQRTVHTGNWTEYKCKWEGGGSINCRLMPPKYNVVNACVINRTNDGICRVSFKKFIMESE